MHVLGLKTVVKRVVIAGSFLLASFAGCDAERDNPYDPKSPYYKPGGVVTGYVKTRTGMPVDGVKITVEPDGHFSYSDVDGFYEVMGLVTEKSRVTATKEGYSSGDTSIVIRLGKKDTANFFLDILPEIVSCRVTTQHTYEGAYGGKYSAIFEAEVFDRDGTGWEDIDSVSVYITGLPDTFSLKFNEPSGLYRREVEASYFPEDSLRGLMGRDCFFKVMDKVHEVTISDPCRAVRIIDKLPKVVMPDNFDTVGTMPELVWENYWESFSYTYTIGVWILEGGELGELICTISEIPRDTTAKISKKVPTDLSPGFYKWKVSVVDEFGNRSVSKSGSFKVQ